MMRTAKFLALAAGCTLWTSFALAQNSEVVVLPPSYPSQSEWTTVTRFAVGDKVRIVSLASVNRKLACTVCSVDADHIACSRRFGRRPIVFREQDVAAVLSAGTGSNDNRDRAICEAVARGIITGAVFLGRTGSAGAIFGATLIGVVGLAVAGICDIADGGGPDVPIYSKPGLQLKGIPEVP